MSEENREKSALVPRLRFPQFSEGWRADRVGKMAEIFKGKGIAKSDISNDGIHLCIRYGELYTVYGELVTEVLSRTSISATELFFGESNDVIIPSSGETKEDIAKAACVIPGRIAFGGDLNVLRTKEIGAFLSYYLNGPLRKNIARVAQGDSVVHLYPYQIEKLPIAVPITSEQQKIADCLSSLDELITAETQKLDALKTHKKGLMQRLFPHEGETVPRLRFPEFRGTGEWDEKRLGEVGSVRMCKRILKEQTSPQGDIPFYKIGTFGGVPDAYISREIFENFRTTYPFPKNGAVLISAAGTIGRTVRYDGELAYFQDSNIVWLENGEALIADNFLLYIYQLINWAPSVGAIQRLYNENILGTQVKFPRSIPEQQKIADCLSSLDNLITAQSQKIATLKTHKQGLMQQLFPVLDEAQT
ncbi:restriction endonuclease subunit S [uncultured Nitrosomonas sp.]|uniref:restriction endonuclease subunit S n=1 Tax=uncultured Nitrosomonas sp. TaxID=156424 RepID=UPI00261DA806|nr:restriction endonuclease subunit S [uncultured Nitrosomonas sp.]